MKINFTEDLIVGDYLNRGYEVTKCDRHGFPDFYFYNPINKRREFVEVKTNHSKIQKHQKSIMSQLKKCGFIVKVVRVRFRSTDPMFGYIRKENKGTVYWRRIEVPPDF
mgnify:CR=1 FL=1